MSTVRARMLAILTLALLIPAVSVAYAQDSTGDDELLDASTPDASVHDGGVGGNSSHSTSVVSNGFGGTRGGGTVELPGPDLNSCSCHLVGQQHARTPGFGLLLLATIGALGKRRRFATGNVSWQ